MMVEKVDKKSKRWGEDEQKALELMLRQFHDQSNHITLDLLGSSTRNSPSSSNGSEFIEFDLQDLDEGQCIPSGWEKCLDLKTGAVFYVNSEEGNEPGSVGFPWQKSSELRSVEEESARRKNRAWCSTEEEAAGRLDLKLNLPTSKDLDNNKIKGDDNFAEEVESGMRLVGCPRCLMYLMICKQDLKCPKCKGSFLLDFLNKNLLSPSE